MGDNTEPIPPMPDIIPVFPLIVSFGIVSLIMAKVIGNPKNIKKPVIAKATKDIGNGRAKNTINPIPEKKELTA